MSFFKIFILNISVLSAGIIKPKKKKNENKYFSNQIKKNLKNEWEKFFKTYHHGHDLSQMDSIKIGDNRQKVNKLFGAPLIINKKPNVEYYISQTTKKRFKKLFFHSSIILRIEYKNGKVSKIKKIPVKNYVHFINPTKTITPLNDKIKNLKIKI